MVRSALFVASLLALPCLATPAVTTSSGASRPDAPKTFVSPVPVRVVPGDVLLKLNGLDEDVLRRADRGERRALLRVQAAIDAMGPEGKGLVYVRRSVIGWALFKFPGLDEPRTEAKVAALAHATGVKGVAANRWMHAFATPNDEYLDFMWHLAPIGANDAWDVTTGTSDQRIGVVDSGTFLSHEDLVGKDQGGFDFVSDDFASNDGDGRDANYNDPGDSADCTGQGAEPDSFHGSHVAGTILANADNGTGIAGINWEAKLITVRALGRCGGSNQDIMEGLAWLAGFEVPGVPALPAADRPRVANLSLGGQGACDQFSREVTDAVADNGTIPVIAAGNDAGPVNSPANCPSAIAVGAYGPGSGNPIASYSSFGDEIDIVGPGGEQSLGFEQGVLSFYSTAIDGDPYTFYQGTSMAAPHVAGVVSLLLALDPTLSRSEVVSVLQSSADTCSGCSGKGALRADLAVAQVSAVTTNPGDSCTSFCSPGQRCIAGTCAATCTGDGECGSGEVCDPVDDVCVAEAGGEGEGEGGGGGGGGGAGSSGAPCDLERGNLDCPNSEGCRPDVTSEGDGICIRGADDGDSIGALCEDDNDCETGLCDRGVCTVTCDFDDGDCKDGFECDEDAVPGGLCRPENCREEDDDFCESGEVCHYSPQELYVCAEGEGNYLRCTHSSRSTHGTPLSAALIAGLLAFVVVRRRR